MSEAFELARTLRAQLKDTFFALEQAAATPAGSPAWRRGLADRLHDVRGALIGHMDEVEAADGLLAQVLAAAPHLEAAVSRIREDHGELCEEVDQVLDLLDEARGAGPDAIRSAVLDLMRMLSEHRQHGADVVYEAWQVDIGDGTL